MPESNRFSEYLKQGSHSARSASRKLTFIRSFEAFLSEQQKSLFTATPDDITTYHYEYQNKLQPFSHYLSSIEEYYEMLGKDDMVLKAKKLKGEVFTAKFKLKDFLDVDASVTGKLWGIGIKTVQDMLKAGRTVADRKELSLIAGTSIDKITELVKLSDQARIGGHRKKRARLFYNAGYDTIDKIAAREPEDIIRDLKNYIAKTGFDGTPPLPKEALNSVRMARYLPRIIEYQ